MEKKKKKKKKKKKRDAAKRAVKPEPSDIVRSHKPEGEATKEDNSNKTPAGQDGGGFGAIAVR